ncbi:MAG: 50S ribosomal protein L7/L12 [Actinomyces succiniciruminis]|nr:50S ribosomal protein L7/L12 [Actinomyces succiniciruminis]
MSEAPRTGLFSWLFGRDKSRATSAPAPTTGATVTGNNAASTMPTGPDTDRVTAEVSAQELVLLYFNEPIAAIKAYRERTGADLKAAKIAIDAAAAEIAAGRAPVVASSSAGPVSSFPQPNPEEIELVTSGRPIAAIKAYRERTGADLKTAKAVIDTIGTD